MRNLRRQAVYLTMSLLIAALFYIVPSGFSETAVPQAQPFLTPSAGSSSLWGLNETSSFHRFKTQYADISYVNQDALKAFLWRITGKKFTLAGDEGFARSRVDRIISRVMDVLDIHPESLQINIKLWSSYKEGKIATYTRSTNTIVIYANKVTDGIFAHEAAHAIIASYFKVPPPEKVQEILAQYVDRHLWDDY